MEGHALFMGQITQYCYFLQIYLYSSYSQAKSEKQDFWRNSHENAKGLK